jgi:hypothetical protein
MRLHIFIVLSGQTPLGLMGMRSSCSRTAPLPDAEAFYDTLVIVRNPGRVSAQSGSQPSQMHEDTCMPLPRPALSRAFTRFLLPR